MTTVGYGDFYPSTSIGRLVGSIVCMSGPVLFIFLATTFIKSMKMSQKQAQAYLQIKKQRSVNETRYTAAKIIQIQVRILRAKTQGVSQRVIQQMKKQQMLICRKSHSLRKNLIVSLVFQSKKPTNGNNISQEIQQKLEYLRKEDLAKIAQIRKL